MTVAPPLKGLVLAGGQSRRMGADKAAINIAGVSLLDRAVATLRTVLADVYVGVRPEQSSEATRRKYPVIADRIEDVGPAAGILAAHLHAPEAAWLVIACDMPLLDTLTVRALVDARDAGQDATALQTDRHGQAEPLCAIYEPGTLAAFLTHIRAGGNSSPKSWLAANCVKLLPAPAPDFLAGANTRIELAAITEQLEAHTGAPGRKN